MGVINVLIITLLLYHRTSALELHYNSCFVVFGESNPTIVFYPYFAQNKENYKLQWDRMREVTPAGDLVQEATFSTDMTYTHPQRGSINGILYQRVNMTNWLTHSNDHTKIKLVLEHYLYENDTNLNDFDGENHIFISAGQINFIMHLENWPWISKNNYLLLEYYITSSNINDTVDVGNGLVKVIGEKNHTLEVKFFKYCASIIESRYVNLPIASIVNIDESSNISVSITIKFSSFDSVSYSSVLGIYFDIPPSSDDGPDYGLIIFLSIGTSLVVMIGFIAAIIHCRRERARRLYELLK